MRSTSRSTAPSTAPSEALTLLSLALVTRGRETRVTVTARSSAGVQRTETWRFTANSFDAMTLAEICAVTGDLAGTGLLTALGIQGALAFELLEASGVIPED